MLSAIKPLQPKLETFKIFKISIWGYRLLGLLPFDDSGLFYYMYIIFINLAVTINYPVTMFIDLFMSENLKHLFSNLSVCFAELMASTKALNVLFKRDQLKYINELLHRFDARQQAVADPDERMYLERIVRIAYRVLLAYFIPFAMAALTCMLPAVFSSDRRLVYAAWFPFDWKNDNWTYLIISTYQVLGIWVTISQNILNDSFPGLYLWTLKGHFRALNIRVSKIGYDTKKSAEQNYTELLGCIADHRMILEFCKVYEKLFGGVLLMQFLITEISVCVTAVYIFFADTAGEMVYTAAYFICVLIEICLPCYCGNEILYENNRFTTALFSCNWMDQNQKFKKTLIFVMQSSLKPLEIYAGGLVRVSISTLLAVFKSTYSLFALVNRLR